jgi:interferon gamma-inducible protein 30
MPRQLLLLFTLPLLSAAVRQVHPQTTPHRRYEAPLCDVPPDFWCDSHEIAQRCQAVQQCDAFKRNRQPITVSLMFEAMCPFCQRFITNHLANLYNTFNPQGVEFELVPFGNSRLLRNGEISCNHGPKECQANKLLGCVIDIVKVKQSIPFLVCFERALSNSDVQLAMHHCSGFVRNAYSQIRQCFAGERGVQLQRQAAHKTMNAKIVEVPYILINNYSPNLDSNQINILSLSQLLQKWVNLRRH